MLVLLLVFTDCQHYWIPAVWFNSRLVQRPKCRERQVYLIADDTCQKDLSSHGAWEYWLDIRDSDNHLLTDDPLFSDVIDFTLDSTLKDELLATCLWRGNVWSSRTPVFFLAVADHCNCLHRSPCPRLDGHGYADFGGLWLR